MYVNNYEIWPIKAKSTAADWMMTDSKLKGGGFDDQFKLLLYLVSIERTLFFAIDSSMLTNIHHESHINVIEW